jgi:hypothetical protein
LAKQKKDPSSKHNPKVDNTYARISGITFELLAINLGFILGGYYLNEKADPVFPWILLLGVFLSVAATIVYLIKKFSS